MLPLDLSERLAADLGAERTLGILRLLAVLLPLLERRLVRCLLLPLCLLVLLLLCQLLRPKLLKPTGAQAVGLLLFCRTLRPYRLASVPPRTTDHRNQLHVQEHIMVGLHDAQTWR